MPELSRRETAAPDNEPDAELLRLHAQCETFLIELYRGKHRDANGDVSDEITGRMDHIERQIAAIPANTFAGIALKLRIGTDNQPFTVDGRFNVDDASADELNLMAALADAERLAARAS